jgi:hypothetical protein
MDSLVFWLDRPFKARQVVRRMKPRPGVVTIRYRGSFARSALKAFVVLALLAFLVNGLGERKSQGLSANEVASTAGAAASPR